MYTKRATFITFNSPRHLHKVCGRNPAKFPCSVRIPDFVRNFGAATERSDICNNFDQDAAENQAGYSSYNQNNQFYSGSLGGFQQRLNPNRVYEQRIGDDRFRQNHSYYNYGNRNMGGGELHESLHLVNGQNSVSQHVSGGKNQQNENFNEFRSRATFGEPSHIHGGVRWENSRKDFAGQSNFAGSYSQNEDMPVQNGVRPKYVAGNYLYNFGNYRQTLSAHQNDGVVDSQVKNDMKLNADSAEVAQVNQLVGKLEDLDKFIMEGKLKEAMELLGLLQKADLQIELPRYIALMKACG